MRMMMCPSLRVGEFLFVFVLLSTFSCSDSVLALFCSKRSLGSSSSVALFSSSFRATVPATPLLSQGGGDVFAAVVPPARSSFGFMKKKIAG